MDRLVEQLSDYAMDLEYEDIPQEVVVRAKALILDTVGCALGAAPSVPARIAREVAAETPLLLRGGPRRSW